MDTYYRLDREEVPEVFYAIKNPHNRHELELGTVLTVSCPHDSEDWVCVGIVAKQTPYGQGVYLGIPKRDLRVALPREIRRALEGNHPEGSDFRPRCREAADISYLLAITSIPNAETTDSETRRECVSTLSNVSREELEEMHRAALKSHSEIMRKWDQIVQRQSNAILRTLAEVPILVG